MAKASKPARWTPPDPPVFTPRHYRTGERLRVPLTPALSAAYRGGAREDDNWHRVDLGVAGIIYVRRAECGLGCRCDAEYAPVEPPPSPEETP